jgi:hypothetical protein
VLLLSLATRMTAVPNVFTPWNGWIQRMVILPYMMWIFTFAYNLRKRAGKME